MIAPLLALLLSADPCASVRSASQPDPDAARAYRAVGESDRALGATDSAIIAFQEALARDPADAASREALHGLCSAPPPEDPYREGLRRMDDGDWRGAATAFRAARTGEAGPSAALLEGICRYEVGDEVEAAALFREAAMYPPHREEAQFYLGLLALRSGSSSEAAALFASASANPALERAANDLARLARRDGRFVMSIFAESGWDSNVNLAPSGAPLGPPASDGLYALTGTGLFRPKGPEGPYFRLSGFLQEQATLDAFDFRGYDVAAGWQLGRTERGVIAEYDYGARTFGGASYLSANRLLASGWMRVGATLIGATYFARFESYAPAWAQFSGTLQRAELRASWMVATRARLAVAYGVAGDVTRDPALTWAEQGPRAELRVALGRMWLGTDVAATWRGYDSVDATLGARRSDRYLDATAFAELDVAANWTARFALMARSADSNVPGFAYDKLLPTLGIGYTLGL
jgi:tetratricopeptide (TPR) repeat protein